MIADCRHSSTKEEPQDPRIRSAMNDRGDIDNDLNGGEDKERPGPLQSRTPTKSKYTTHVQALQSFQQVTQDDASGALTDCSFCTVSDASRACSLPLESWSDQHREDSSLPWVGTQQELQTIEQPGRSARVETSRFAGNQPSSRKKKSARKKSGRLLLAKNLVKDATNWLDIGEDEKALKAYQQAIQIAGSEIARINVKIRTSASHSNVVQRSIKDRLSQDLRKVGVSIGKLRTKMAIVYEKLGDYDNAILCCQEAKALYSTLPDIEGRSSKNLVEVTQSMIEQLDSTRAALGERRSILQELEAFRAEAERTKDPKRRVKCFDHMEKLASSVLAMEVKILGACHPQVADSLQLLSTISLEKSNPVRAIHHLSQAIAISQECLGEKHPRIGQYCLRLARICQSSGAETKALEHFEKAVTVLSFSPKYSRMLGSTMNDIAVLHMRRAENIIALEKLHLALKHYSSTCERQKEGVIADIIQVHQNMATCYVREGNFGRAREIYEKVLDLQSNTRKLYDGMGYQDFVNLDFDQSSSTGVHEDAIAQTLVNLGRASAAEGYHEEAISSFKKALDKYNFLAAEESLYAGEGKSNYADYKRKITKVLFCIAEENLAIGSFDEAMKFYTESIGIFCLLGEDLQSANADHVAHCNLGISKVFLERNDIISAHRLLKKTMRNCLNGKIKAADKTLQTVRIKLDEVEADLKQPSDECLCGLEENARKQIEANALDVALLNLRAALSIRKKKLSQLKAMKRDVSQEVEGIAHLLDMFGLVYTKQGDSATSTRVYNEAYKLRSETNG